MEHILSTLFGMQSQRLWQPYSANSTASDISLASDSRLRAVYYSALGYIQSGAEKALTADPKYTDITFAMLASAAPGFTPSADGQRIIDRTLQSVIERWKSLTVQDKIEAALY